MVVNKTAIGRLGDGLSIENGLVGVTGRASSTIATQSIYVNKAATGGGTGVDWTNAFTTIQAAINSLPAVIAHAVTIYVRKGSTAYAENIVIKRIIGAGSITLRGEFYWYGTVASTATGKINLGSGDFGYANRAQIAAGDIVWATKWSGTVLASTPSESIVDTVASVSNAEVTLTTNTGKEFTNAWTYQIAKTVTQSVSITNTGSVTISGLILSYAGNVCTFTGAISPIVEYCHITSTAASSYPIYALGNSSNVKSTRCRLTSDAVSANGILATSSSFAVSVGNIIEITDDGANSYGVKVVDSYIALYYNHIKDAIVGLIAQRGGVIFSVSNLNEGTTPLNPANWAASVDGGVIV